LRPSAQQAFGDVGDGVRGEVVVGGTASERRVPDRAAHQSQPVAGGLEPLGEVDHRGIELEQCGGQAAPRLLG
jgi:hypothetical protein